MGIFSTYNGSSVLDSLDFGPISSIQLETMNFTAEGMQFYAESELLFNTIVQEVCIDELNYFEEHGEEIIYEAGSSKTNGFFAKIAKFFKMVLDKIKELWYKFEVWFAEKTKTTNTFWAKNSGFIQANFEHMPDDYSLGKLHKGIHIPKDIAGIVNRAIDKVNSKLEINVNFGGLNAIQAYLDKNTINDKEAEALDKIMRNINEYHEAIPEMLRGAIVQDILPDFKKDALTADEFNIAMQVILYGDGEEYIDATKKDLKSIGFAISRAMKFDDDFKMLKAETNATIKAFDKEIKAIEIISKKSFEAQTDKSDKNVFNKLLKLFSFQANILKVAKQCTMVMLSHSMQAAKFRKEDRNKLLITILKYSPNKDKDSESKDKDSTAVNDTFRKAVESKNLRRCRIMIKDSLLYDLTFKAASNMINYCDGKIDLFEEHDGREFKPKSEWTKDYMNDQLVKLVFNFSKERLKHCKDVIDHIYNEKSKKSTNENAIIKPIDKVQLI